MNITERLVSKCLKLHCSGAFVPCTEMPLQGGRQRAMQAAEMVGRRASCHENTGEEVVHLLPRRATDDKVKAVKSLIICQYPLDRRLLHRIVSADM